jgi:glutamine amidotransferase
MLAIVDYRMGNIHSLSNALAFLGCEVRVSRDPEVLLAADKLILPGVGAFDAAMANLRTFGLVGVLDEAVKGRGVPVLGICVGMQIMASRGTENGLTEGLGWIDGTVEAIAPMISETPVPHVGFNDVSFPAGNEDLVGGFAGPTDFYFVHGYHMACIDPADRAGTVDYGGKVLTAMVRRSNVLGVQFHPEKSQSNGLKLLAAFLKY